MMSDQDHAFHFPQPAGSLSLSGLSDQSPAASSVALPAGIPAFEPARGLRNGHLQTMYASLWMMRPAIAGTVQRYLRFEDGDRTVLHDDVPDGWQQGDHVALLMHGLAGCYSSGYMVRAAAKLMARNVRVFRMDHRGCGAGRMLASNPYHAGRIQDLGAAVRMIERLCPGSPVSIAGYSLSANLLLRYLGNDPPSLPLCLYRAVAVCPPIDLQHCVQALAETRLGQRYDWYFAKQLMSHLAGTPQWRDDLPLAMAKRPPKCLLEFDELYTAPASGFDSASHYYSEASARAHMHRIEVHTTVLSAEDDPLVSSTPWKGIKLPANIRLCMTAHGGHMGFVGRPGVDPDSRWMDWRVVDGLLD